MRRLLLGGLCASVLAGVVLLATDGPLTPLMNLRTKTNENGYLLVSAGAAGVTDGPLTPMANLRGRTNESGYLRVAFAGTSQTLTGPLLLGDGTAAAPSYSFTNQTGTGLYYSGSILNIANAGTRMAGFGSTGMILLSDVASIVMGASLDVAIARLAAGQFILRLDSTHGIATDVNTDGTLKVLSRAGADTAITTTNVFTATGKVTSPILQGTGTGVAVANVGANSCGTTTATIAGNQVSGVITVGTIGGTQCRVTFSTAAPVARDCMVTDSTTTIATRSTVVDTTNTDFLGAFVAGDKVTYLCTVR